MSKWMGPNWHWSFDFFMFKPDKLPWNTFQRRMSGSVERQLSNSPKTNNVSIMYIQRYNNDKFFVDKIDTIGLFHKGKYQL